MADAESGGQGEERPDAGRMRTGVNPPGDVAGGLVSGGGASGLDDAEGIGRGICDAENIGATDAQSDVSRDSSHLSVYRQQQSSPEHPGPTNGFWGSADWLFCRDSKWRPAMSNTSPLVNGISPGVGSRGSGNRSQRLKGYGNAIVVPLAIEFIKAFLEAENDG